MIFANQDIKFLFVAVTVKRDTPAYGVSPAGPRPTIIDPAAAFTYKRTTCLAVIHHAKVKNRKNIIFILLQDHVALNKKCSFHLQFLTQTQHIIGGKG
jgi:hypothetical protein